MKAVLLAISLVSVVAGISLHAAEEFVPAEQMAAEIGDTSLANPELNDGDVKQEPPIECRTVNARGEAFSAYGWRPVYTQRRATDKCYTESKACFVQGCHHVSYPR